MTALGRLTFRPLISRHRGAGGRPLGKYHQHKEVDDVVKRLVDDEGWRLQAQGHGYYLYCPCGADSIMVAGTPQNSGNHAKRIARAAERCPDQHERDTRPRPKGRR
jgi:hypothetical protein